MKDFWRLIGFLISLTGFLVVAAALLVRGDCLLMAAVKAVLTFIVLWGAQCFLQALLAVAAEPRPDTGRSDAQGQQ